MCYIHLHISKKNWYRVGCILTDHIYNTHLYNIKIIIFIYIKVYEEMFVDIIHSCLVERLHQLWACYAQNCRAQIVTKQYW